MQEVQKQEGVAKYRVVGTLRGVKLETIPLKQSRSFLLPRLRTKGNTLRAGPDQLIAQGLSSLEHSDSTEMVLLIDRH